MLIEIADDGRFYNLLQCVDMIHVDGKDTPVVFRVPVSGRMGEWVYYVTFADYAALKAAWPPAS